MRAAFVAFCVLLVSGAAAYHFPLYKQCDPQWGSDMMGVQGPGERNTICNEGCAMSSTAMALAGLGVTIGGAPVNPGTFNTWLKNNQGYLCMAGDCNNLNLTAPERLSSVMSLIGEYEKPSFDKIAREIRFERIIYVAHVRNNSHFVLLTDAVHERKSFKVNDPGFNETEYPYANISDIIRFKIDVYPVYKQCNSSWGPTIMGGDNDTICEVGCLMSSISMALAGTGIEVDNQTASPATVNRWLQQNSGYVPGSSALMESKIPLISPGRITWSSSGMHLSNNIPFEKIQELIDSKVPSIVIANVMHGHHFVLVVGYRHDGDTLVVNDPGFNRNTYSYMNDVVGWRVFGMH